MIKTIKGWNNHTLVKAVQLAAFFITIPALVVLVVNFTWFYLCVMLLSVVMIAKVGHSIGQHRYFCHRSFQTTRAKEWLIGVCATLCTSHTPIYYSAVHRYHHATSDTEADPHSPSQIGMTRGFLGLIDETKAKNIPARIIRDLVGNPVVMFFHNWYWPTIVAYLTLLVMIDPMLVLFCYVIPVGYTKFITGSQISLGHGKGYRNFDTRDASVNNIFINYLTLGEGLHNNHHARASEFDFGYTRKPYEWDFCGTLVRWFFL